jgi:hypothetical protein
VRACVRAGDLLDGWTENVRELSECVTRR